MALTINDVTPVVSYTATSGQTTFAYPFEIFDEGDIVVTVEGTTLTYAASPADNTQYSLTGVGTEGGGNIVVGGVGVTLNEQVVIYRDIPIERSADYPETGPMSVAALNTEQAKHIAIMQQLERDIGLSVRVEPGDTPVVLPDDATRASTYFAFDETGAFIGASGTDTIPASQAEAEAGVENTKFMSPLRTKQALDAQAPLTADTILINNSGGTAREAKTFAQVRDALGIYNGMKHIKDFCPANGVDDDGPGLEAALDSGYPIIGEGVTLTILTQAQTDVSSFGASLIGLPAQGGETTVTGITIESALNNPLHIQNSQFRCENVTFSHTGTAKDPNAVAVVCDRESTGTNTDDIDSKFRNVKWLNYGVAVRQNGRGLDVRGGVVNNCADGFIWSFPATGTSGDPIQTDPTLGTRAFEIRGVKGHNMSSLVKQTGSYPLRAFLIADCDIDLGDTIFEGDCEDGIIANNICRFSEGLEGGVYITGYGSRMQIVGNRLGGGTLTGTQAGTIGVYFSLTGDVEDTLIANNIFHRWAWNAIKFGANARPYRCQLLGNIGENLGRDAIELAGGSFMTRIQGGCMSNYGTDAVTNRAGVRLGGTHTRLSISHVDFDPIQATARNVYMDTTPTLTTSHMVYNNSTYVGMVTGGYTDGGGNDIATGNRT